MNDELELAKMSKRFRFHQDISAVILMHLHSLTDIPIYHLHHMVPGGQVVASSVIHDLLSTKFAHVVDHSLYGHRIESLRITERGRDDYRNYLAQSPGIQYCRDRVVDQHKRHDYFRMLRLFTDADYCRGKIYEYGIMGCLYSSFYYTAHHEDPLLRIKIINRLPELIFALELLYDKYLMKSGFFYHGQPLVKLLTEIGCKLEFSRTLQSAFVLAKLSQGNTSRESLVNWNEQIWPTRS